MIIWPNIPNFPYSTQKHVFIVLLDAPHHFSMVCQLTVLLMYEDYRTKKSTVQLMDIPYRINLWHSPLSFAPAASPVFTDTDTDNCTPLLRDTFLESHILVLPRVVPCASFYERAAQTNSKEALVVQISIGCHRLK